MSSWGSHSVHERVETAQAANSVWGKQTYYWEQFLRETDILLGTVSEGNRHTTGNSFWVKQTYYWKQFLSETDMLLETVSEGNRHTTGNSFWGKQTYYWEQFLRETVSQGNRHPTGNSFWGERDMLLKTVWEREQNWIYNWEQFEKEKRYTVNWEQLRRTVKLLGTVWEWENIYYWEQFKKKNKKTLETVGNSLRWIKDIQLETLWEWEKIYCWEQLEKEKWYTVENSLIRRKITSSFMRSSFMLAHGNVHLVHHRGLRTWWDVVVHYCNLACITIICGLGGLRLCKTWVANDMSQICRARCSYLPWIQ